MGNKRNLDFHNVVNQTMTGTQTILSAVTNVQNLDNLGLEIAWTGTPTGTISILGSNSNVNFYPLTFSPLLTQPAGSAGGYLVNLSGFPFFYIQISYVNASGSGVLNTYLSGKDLN